MIQSFFFLVRYIPFWTIPIMIICAEFALVFWRRGKKKAARIYIGIVIVCAIFTGFYFWAGSPSNAVRIIIDLFSTQG